MTASPTTTQQSPQSTQDSLIQKRHQQAFELIAQHPTLLQHEETFLKTPSAKYDLKTWWLYLEDIDSLLQDVMLKQANKKNQTKAAPSALNDSSEEKTLSRLLQVRDLIGRRSIAALPGSYKLWKHHWEFLVQQHNNNVAATNDAISPSADANNSDTPSEDFCSTRTILQAFETALRTLHKFPKVWIDYLQFVLSLPNQYLFENPNTTTATAIATAITSTTKMLTKTTFLRLLANRAVQALPLAQHEEKIWPVLLECWKDEKDLAEFDQELGGLLNDDDDDGNDNDTHVESAAETQLRVETRCRLLRRFCMLQPSFRATMCNFYKEHEKWGEAALLYQQMLQLQEDGGGETPSSSLQSLRNTPEYYNWWTALADLCTQHPVEVEQAGVPWDAMVRAAVSLSSNSGSNVSSSSGGPLLSPTTTESTVLQEMQGLLWSKLADSWMRRGEFDLARSVLEEGMESVSRVRDFTILFDAYLQFEEGLLEAVTEQLDEEEEGDDNEEDETTHSMGDDWDILLGGLKATTGDNDGEENTQKKSSQTMADMELALARAEHLTARRPLLLNRVLLRQNPNNVGEWVERSKLYVKQGEPIMATSALEEGLKTVQAPKANNGSPSTLVTELVKLYELRSLDKARDLLDRICNQQEYTFRDPNDMAECYAAWAELELRHECWDEALAIVRSAVAPVRRQQARDGGNQKVLNLTKSLRLWDLLLDLEESLGTVQTAKDAYNRAMEIKVATPLHILNFCSFLTEHKYFEESFTAFERGIELFAFPHAGAKLLWKAYIEAFNERYSGTKVERMRDLFQRCLETCPAEDCAEFFMMNGAFEEQYGLTKRALSVYGSMCKKLPKEEKFTAYQLYIAKATKYLGLTATRDIYQEAIEALEDTPSSQLCQDFAKMETSLQEIERARAVLTYGAQMADPRRNPEYWKAWNEFEIAHGNEETFREMLRIKRSVEAAFSTVNYNAAEMGAGGQIENLSNEDAMNMIASREGVDVGEQNKPTISGFVKGGKRAAEVANLDEVEERVAKLRKATAASSGGVEAGGGGDDDEIDIDDEEDDEDDVEEEDDCDGDGEIEPAAPTRVNNVMTKSVPSAVFGGLAAEAAKESGDEKKGALERLRAAAASRK